MKATVGCLAGQAMKLHQFEALVAVVEQGGIRAAARSPKVSQAAVTKSMRLLARARVITRQVALARDDLRQAGGDDAGTLRVGLTPFLNFTALGATFSWFRQRYRHVEMPLIERAHAAGVAAPAQRHAGHRGRGHRRGRARRRRLQRARATPCWPTPRRARSPRWNGCSRKRSAAPERDRAAPADPARRAADPAAEYFAHCLARVCGAATPG